MRSVSERRGQSAFNGKCGDFAGKTTTFDHFGSALLDLSPLHSTHLLVHTLTDMLDSISVELVILLFDAAQLELHRLLLMQRFSDCSSDD